MKLTLWIVLLVGVGLITVVVVNLSFNALENRALENRFQNVPQLIRLHDSEKGVTCWSRADAPSSLFCMADLWFEKVPTP